MLIAALLIADNMDSNGSQCFCLRWNNFQSSVVTVMRTLLQDRAFLDVTLACDGRSLQAHRLVLASCSDFFSDVLKENQTEHPIIFLRDVSFWELEAIMDFIYNGQVNIMREQLPGFIRTAQLEPMALDTKFRVRSQSPRASPPIAASPPTTPSFKKRRHDSPIPLPLSSPRFGDPEGPPRSLDEDGPNLKSSSPFGITDTIQSLAFSGENFMMYT
ncbi:hypothetical protein HAZT_HAZT010178 [Hyalella azteca]|uniref:BTB domain-containing protein n=1 Tax=Hyalella azteca TaxID=294128 RepID=A0A6A0GXU5_HYAAZ|nr:hypothetical protein HAZT_HAZT010178 [Hyalella azteca]